MRDNVLTQILDWILLNGSSSDSRDAGLFASVQRTYIALTGIEELKSPVQGCHAECCKEVVRGIAEIRDARHYHCDCCLRLDLLVRKVF